VLAVKASGYNAFYEEFELTDKVQKVVRLGRNVMALHCHQTVGGQYIDAGLVGMLAKTSQR
jgi:hypothetical protein